MNPKSTERFPANDWRDSKCERNPIAMRRRQVPLQERAAAATGEEIGTRSTSERNGIQPKIRMSLETQPEVSRKERSPRTPWFFPFENQRREASPASQDFRSTEA